MLFSLPLQHVFINNVTVTVIWKELPTGNKFALVLMIVQKKVRKQKCRIFVFTPPTKIISYTFKGTHTTS
jgi:hypothetical protein